MISPKYATKLGARGDGRTAKFQNLDNEGQKKVVEKLVLQTFENQFFNAFGTDLVQLTHLGLPTISLSFRSFGSKISKV